MDTISVDFVRDLIERQNKTTAAALDEIVNTLHATGQQKNDLCENTAFLDVRTTTNWTKWSNCL